MRPDKRWVKKSYELISGDWTAVAPPLDFDYFAMRCDTSEITFRTDVADATTEDVLEATVQDGVTAPFTVRYVPNGYGVVFRKRFPADVPICYAKSTKPTATLKVTWVL